MNSVMKRVANIQRVLLVIVFSMVSGIEAGKNKCPIIVNPKTGTVCPGGSRTFDALAGNSGKKIHLVEVSQPTNGGTATINRRGNTFTYTAPDTAPLTGEDHFTYTLEDTCGKRKTAPVTITVLCCDEFSVNNKSIQVNPLGTLTFNALKGNSGCNLALVSVSRTANGGTVTADTRTGEITYAAPNDPTITSDRFSYTLSQSPPFEEKTAEIFVTISPCTVPFVVNDKSGTVAPLGSQTFNALSGNSGVGLTLVSVSTPVNGGTAIANVENNTFTYEAPNDPSIVEDSFTYTMAATCPGPSEKTGRVTMTIGPCTAPFVVNPKSGLICPGDSLSFDALAGNSGCDLTIDPSGFPKVTEFGTATLVGNIITYTGNADVPEGTIDIFNYTMTASGESDPKSATITVRFINQDFIVNPLTATICPDTSKTFDAIIPNNGCNRVVIGVTQPAEGQGSTTFDPEAGTITYNPPVIPLVSGTIVSFTYTLRSGIGEQSADVTITIMDEAFILNAIELIVCPLEDRTISIEEYGRGCDLKLVSVSTPIHGTLVSVDPITGLFTYKAAGTIPADSLDFFTVTASATTPDTASLSKRSRRAARTKAAVDALPASPDGIVFKSVVQPVTYVDKPFIVVDLPVAGATGAATGVVPGDSAILAPGDSVTFDPFAACSTCNAVLSGVTQPPANVGTVTPDFATGKFTFTASPGVNPDPVTRVVFTYTLREGNVEKTANVTVLIVQNPLIADPIDGEICPSGSITFQPFETGSGGTRVLLSVTQPPAGQGTVTIIPGNRFTYTTPDVIPTGTIVRFTATVALANNLSITAVAPVTVTIVDTPLTVVPLTANVGVGGSFLFSPLRMDSGCNIMLQSVTQPPAGQGTVTINQDNTFTYYPPLVPLQPGTIVPFTYTMIDAQGNTVTQDVTVRIINEPFTVPTIVGQSCPGGSMLFDPLSVGSGVNRQLVAVTQPPAGQGTVVPNFTTKTFTYIAPLNLATPTVVSFTYTMRSGTALLTGNVQVSVNSVPFVVDPLSETLCPGASITLDPLAVGSGCDRSMVTVTQPPAGQGQVSRSYTDNTLTYTSPPGLAAGTKVPFTYTLRDASGALLTEEVTIEIIRCPSCNTAIIHDPFFVLYNQLILNQ